MTSEKIQQYMDAANICERKMQAAIDEFEATEKRPPPMDNLIALGVQRVKLAVLECALQLALMNEREERKESREGGT